MADNIEGNGAQFAIPFIFIHAVFMFGIPYFMMRRSARKMKHDLEREFFYLTKK
jgi:preprotein translocase subunit YajC